MKKAVLISCLVVTFALLGAWAHAVGEPIQPPVAPPTIGCQACVVSVLILPDGRRYILDTQCVTVTNGPPTMHLGRGCEAYSGSYTFDGWCLAV